MFSRWLFCCVVTQGHTALRLCTQHTYAYYCRRVCVRIHCCLRVGGHHYLKQEKVLSLHCSSLAQGRSHTPPLKLYLRHSGMPHLNVTYNKQTGRLDLKLTRKMKVRISTAAIMPYVVKSTYLLVAYPRYLHTFVGQSPSRLINGLHLEGTPLDIQCDRALINGSSERRRKERSKTDWHRKDQLVAEFKANLQLLTSPLRRVLGPPAGTPYPEVIHQIMFHQKKGWRPLPHRIPSEPSPSISEASWNWVEEVVCADADITGGTSAAGSDSSYSFCEKAKSCVPIVPLGDVRGG